MHADVKGRVVAVTGGAGGIGMALCRRLGRAGATIAVLDLSSRALQRTAASLQSDGVEAIALSCNVTDPVACQEAVQEICARFGGIDILCNNAGITQVGRFVQIDDAAYRDVIEVNFFGAVNMTRAALASLLERQGKIVITSSIAGFAPLYGRTGYAASRHALHGFFTTLRVELLGTGVDVLIVCPGFTHTGIRNQQSAREGADSRLLRVNGKEASPELVAESVFEAIVHRRRQIILGFQGRLAWLLTFLAPRLYDRLMLKKIVGETRRKHGSVTSVAEPD